MLTIPFSLISRPSVSCRPRRVTPSSRVALTTSPPSRCPVASPPSRCLVASPCRVALSRRLRRVVLSRCLVASPPRHASPLRHASLVLHADLWGKWRGSSEWVGRGGMRARVAWLTPLALDLQWKRERVGGRFGVRAKL